MSTIIQASPRTWLPVIQTRLITVTGLPAERVRIVARQNVPQPHTQDVLLRLGGFRSRGEITLAAGRVHTVLERSLIVTVRTRLAVDSPEDDPQWVTDGTLGHFQLEDQVIDSLQNYQPVDGSDNWLVVEPLQLLSGPDPGKEEDGGDNGQSVLVFGVSYLPIMSQNYV